MSDIVDTKAALQTKIVGQDTDGVETNTVDSTENNELKSHDLDTQRQIRLTNFLLKEILRQIKITNTHLAELSDYNEEDFEMDME